MNLYHITLTAPGDKLACFMDVITAPDADSAVAKARSAAPYAEHWDADILELTTTTQEAITEKALPAALGGPLPGDWAPTGTEGLGRFTRPGERRLAARDWARTLPEPTGTYQGLNVNDAVKLEAIIARTHGGGVTLATMEAAEMILRAGS